MQLSWICTFRRAATQAAKEREMNHAKKPLRGGRTARPKISEIVGRAARTKNLGDFRASSFSEGL